MFVEDITCNSCQAFAVINPLHPYSVRMITPGQDPFLVVTTARRNSVYFLVFLLNMIIHLQLNKRSKQACGQCTAF